MPMVQLFTGLNISASGLRAMRLKQNLIASNIANAETTRTAEGGPYRRQTAVLRADPIEVNPRLVMADPSMVGWTTSQRHMPIPSDLFQVRKDKIGTGVTVDRIAQDESPPRLAYDPSHPDANSEGYVAYPNINVVQEMVDLIATTRAYEANTTAMASAKSILAKSLEI
ncbi:MAG TPA: flagellar basal body rod protein FlgC [Fibrobacteria bacterium]|nr:flagellar basal body rod protein FlgC [Fibrobacteria bacterium]